MNRVKNLLLTGLPGCGKTTLVLRLIERLADWRWAGFVTEELRERGQRVGFAAVGLSGQRVTLAHVQFRSHLRVGRYGVEPERLEALLRGELERRAEEVDAFVIDEIGKMELLSPDFCEVVPRLLAGPVPVVATVALHGSGLTAAVKRRADCRLVEVSAGNRDELPGQLGDWLRTSFDRSMRG